MDIEYTLKCTTSRDATRVVEILTNNGYIVSKKPHSVAPFAGEIPPWYISIYRKDASSSPETQEHIEYSLKIKDFLDANKIVEALTNGGYIVSKRHVDTEFLGAMAHWKISIYNKSAIEQSDESSAGNDTQTQDDAS